MSYEVTDHEPDALDVAVLATPLLVIIGLGGAMLYGALTHPPRDDAAATLRHLLNQSAYEISKNDSDLAFESSRRRDYGFLTSSSSTTLTISTNDECRVTFSFHGHEERDSYVDTIIDLAGRIQFSPHEIASIDLDRSKNMIYLHGKISLSMEIEETTIDPGFFLGGTTVENSSQTNDLPTLVLKMNDGAPIKTIRRALYDLKHGC